MASVDVVERLTVPARPRSSQDALAARASAWAAVWGRRAFALGTIGFGVHHLVAGAFATRVLPGWPFSADPAPWAFLVGLFLVAAGVASLADWRRPVLPLALAALWLLGLALHAPRVAARWWAGGAWTAPNKNLVLAAGALLLAAAAVSTTVAATAAAARRRRQAWTLARFVLGSFLALCGVQHFVYLGFVATLVPQWIPGATFWAAACGAALIASGVGLAFAATARLTGLFAGIMIASWFLILHIPRAVEAWSNPGEWSGVCESLAIAGVAWLVAGDRAGDA